MNKQTPIGGEAIRLLRSFLINQYGSIRRASHALGWGRKLSNYFCGRSFPLDVFLDVVVSSGFPLHTLEGRIDAFAGSVIHLADVPSPEEPDRSLIDVQAFTAKICRKIRADVIELGFLDGVGVSKGFEDLNLAGLHVVSVRLDKEWRLLKKELRRRRPGGILISDESMQSLGRCLLLRSAVEMKLERFSHAAEYLRCFFRIPLEGGSLRCFGLVTLVMLLRQIDSRRAMAVSEMVLPEALGYGDDALTAFVALTYSAVLSDLGKSEASINLLKLTLDAEGSLWSWYGAVSLGEAFREMGQYEECLAILSRIDVPRAVPHLKYRQLSTYGCAHLGLGRAKEARAYLWESLRTCPEILGPFRLVILLIDLLKAGEDRTMVFQELRNLDKWMTCADRRSSPKLRGALQLLEKELLRPDGLRLPKLEAARAMCG